MTIDTHNCQVKLYPYRSAQVGGHIARLSYDAVQPLHELLAEMAGAQRGNHEVYEISAPRASTLYILFTDESVVIGSVLIARGW